MPIAPSQRAQRFIEIYATGEHSQAQAYALAGYANADNANASKMVRKYAAEIAAHRERLGIAPPGEEVAAESAIDEATRGELIRDLRRLYSLALEKGEIGPATKALRGIERLMKRPGLPGRPTTQPETAKPQTERMAPEDFESLVAAFLTEDDLADIEATWGNEAPPWGRVSRVSGEPVTATPSR